MSVAYIWSPQLQSAADALPANLGRSSRVHALIRALGLVRTEDNGQDEDEDEEKSNNRNEDADVDKVNSGNGGATDQNEEQPKLCPNNAMAIAGHASPTQWAPARLVPPDLALATEAELKKYHDARYVAYLLKNGIVADATSDSASDHSSDSASDADSDAGRAARRRKRRRIQAAGLEYDCPPFPGLGTYARLVAASTLTACRLVAGGSTRTAIVWDGGRHHAQRAQASGFCYVADAVLGILFLTRSGVPCARMWGGNGNGNGNGNGGTNEAERGALGASLAVSSNAAVNGPGDGDRDRDRDRDRDAVGEETHPGVAPETQRNASTPTPPPRAPARPLRGPRILYLDLDLHYGDGVALAFRSPAHYASPLSGKPRPPQVLTLSVHHHAPIFFPPGAPGLTDMHTPHPFSLAYPLAAYPSSATYARAWAAVERVAAAWAPDYVVLQLGVDGLPRDPVGMYGAWGVQGAGSVPWVVEQVAKWDRPTVILGGGGYVNDNAARAWALATAAVVGKPLAAHDDIPDHEFWQEYAPAYTLEVPESHIPDENTPEALDEADAAFEVLAERIREIVALHP